MAFLGMDNDEKQYKCHHCIKPLHVPGHRGAQRVLVNSTRKALECMPKSIIPSGALRT